MRYFILLLTFYASSALSASINLGVLTHHNDAMACGYECNEKNNLIAIEHRDWLVATFNNSYHHRTYLVAKNFKLNNNIGILAGISHGYDRDCFDPLKFNCEYDGEYNKQFMPFGALLIQKDINKIQLSWIEAFTYRSFFVGIKLHN